MPVRRVCGLSLRPLEWLQDHLMPQSKKGIVATHRNRAARMTVRRRRDHRCRRRYIRRYSMLDPLAILLAVASLRTQKSQRGWEGFDREPARFHQTRYSLAKVLIIIDDRNQGLRRQFGLLHLSTAHASTPGGRAA